MGPIGQQSTLKAIASKEPDKNSKTERPIFQKKGDGSCLKKKDHR